MLNPLTIGLCPTQLRSDSLPTSSCQCLRYDVHWLGVACDCDADASPFQRQRHRGDLVVSLRAPFSSRLEYLLDRYLVLVEVHASRMNSCLLFGILLCASLAFAPFVDEAEQRVLRGTQTSLSGVPKELNFTSTSPHIFSSLRSLLQHWPNTFFPNGHSIVPCEVPAYTRLYHARRDNQIPPDPEWFAFDIEMSYGIMGSTRHSHMLTYQSVKPISCLYFDGMSAALMGTGQLDSQMVFLYGNTTGPPPPEMRRPISGIFDELERAHHLCKWVKDNDLGGLGWGVEGMVRMNAGFEMIWCNFSSPSVRLLSHLNVTAPLLEESSLDDEGQAIGIDRQALAKHAPAFEESSLTSGRSLFPLPSSTTRKAPSQPSGIRPPHWRELALEPFLMSGIQEWFRSATWHYGSSAMGPGRPETRVKPLICGFMSYYDSVFSRLGSDRAMNERNGLNLSARGLWQGPGPQGNRTTALKELARRRRNHTLAAIDATEAPFMTTAIADFLGSLNSTSRSHHSGCSGVDWAAMSHEISLRYSMPLLQLSHALASPPLPSENSTAARKFLARARNKSHALLMPFMEYPDSAAINSTFEESEWTLESKMAKDTFSRCKYSYTCLLYNGEGNLRNEIGRPERVIIEATEDVLAAICAGIISVGFKTEYEWLSRWNTPNAPATHLFSLNLTDLALSSQRELEELMAWLGWAQDEVRCEKLCSQDEYCYIPMWPLIFLNTIDRRQPPHYYPPNNGTRPEPPNGEHPPYQNDSTPPKWGSPPDFPDLEQDLWNPQCVKIRG